MSFMEDRSMRTHDRSMGNGDLLPESRFREKRKVEGQVCHPPRIVKGEVEGQMCHPPRIGKGGEEWKGKCANH